MQTPCHFGCRLSLVMIAICIAGLPLVARSAEPLPADPEKLAAHVKDILRARCAECHGGTSMQADINIMDWTLLRDKKVVVPKQPDQSPLYQTITNADEDVRMPQDLPALPDRDVDLIRKWILAGAPEFPRDVAQPKEMNKDNDFQAVVGVDHVLKQIQVHQRTLTGEERQYVRYFSCHHLLAAGVTRETLDLQRQALSKAINHLSHEPLLVKPAAINGEIATIFAVDIRKLGWHKIALRAPKTDQAGEATLNLYDLVLLEYPYAIVYEDSATFDALATEYLAVAKLARPIPFVRSDWFCSVATQPPLYHDLLQLPQDLASLEHDLDVDVEANVTHRQAKRGGMTVSGVSRNNRAVERHPYRHGAYWKSIDYASSKGNDNIFTNPIHLQGTGGEMIFNLPNGLQAYYVTDSKGIRLNDAPTSIVTDRFAEDKTVRNGLSCMRCHDRGMKEFRDDVRPAIEKISGSGLINRRDVLGLYPTHEEMTELVGQDRERFLAALERLFGAPQDAEPLIPVSQRFLDAPLPLTSVSGELGLADATDLKAVFRQPHFTGLGLVSLGDAGVIRRDMWEDYFDQVVRGLGLGVPVLPLDGLTRPDYLPQSTRLNVQLSTSKKNNVFAPGDQLNFFVENRGKSPLFIELIGTGTKGEKVTFVPNGTKVAPGETFRFPENGSVTVQPALGKEQVTLFASETAFPAGRVFRGKNVQDRVVHDFYRVEMERGETRTRNDGSLVFKSTIEFETR